MFDLFTEPKPIKIFVAKRYTPVYWNMVSDWTKYFTY